MTVDPLTPEFSACPFENLQQLQTSDSPVYQVPGVPLVLVTEHEDCLQVLRNPGVYSSSHQGFHESMLKIGLAPTSEQVEAIRSDGLEPTAAAMPDDLIRRDPPRHTRQRRLISRWFIPRRVDERWTPLVEEQVDALIACFERRGEVEFMSEFAVPLPIRLIAAILGVDAEREADFKRWSDTFMYFRGGQKPSAQWWVDRSRAMAEMKNFFTEELVARFHHPREDLLSDLAAATREKRDPTTGDDPLSMEEALNIVYLLLVAGNETTTQLLGGLVWELARRPDDYRRMQGNPPLIDTAVEEGLRVVSPVVGQTRYCLVDTELHGTSIPAGSVVIVFFAGGNYDPTAFIRAASFDLDRPNLQKHLSFGFGIHVCIGAPLARLETRVALRRLLERISAPRLVEADPAEWAAASFSSRGLTRLPLEFSVGWHQ
jgi:cytochrome P450